MFKKLKTTIITSSFLLIIFLSHFIAYPLFAKIALKPIVSFEDRVVIEGFSMIAVCAILFFAFILFGAIKNLILTIISEIREFNDFLKTRKDPTYGRVSALDPVWETRQTNISSLGINTSAPSSLITTARIDDYFGTSNPMPEPDWAKELYKLQQEQPKKVESKPIGKLRFINDA